MNGCVCVLQNEVLFWVITITMTSTSDGGRGGGLRVSSPSSLGLSLERLLEVAHATGELLLTCRNLKTFPAKHRCKYDLKDTVTVGKFRKEVCGFDFKALSRHDLNSFGNHSFIKKLRSAVHFLWAATHKVCINRINRHTSTLPPTLLQWLIYEESLTDVFQVILTRL